MKKISFPSSSVALRLLTSVIPVALFGIFLTAFLAYHIAKPHILKNVRNNASETGFNVAQSISNFFKQRANDVELIAENPMFADYFNNMEFGLALEAESNRKVIEQYLLRFSQRSEVYDRIWFLDGQKREISAIREDQIITKKGRELDRSVHTFLPPAPLAERFMSSIVMSESGPVVFYVKPLYGLNQEYGGCLILACQLDKVRNALNQFDTGGGSWAYIADAKSRPVLSLDKDKESINEINRKKGVFFNSNPIPGTPWFVRALVNSNDFLIPLKHIRFLTAWLSLFSGFLVAVFLYFRIRSLIRPIQKLNWATKRLAAGSLTERVPVTSRDEIGALSKSFNQMAETLQSRTRDLEKRIRELNVLAMENSRLLKSIRRSEMRHRTTLDCSVDAIVGLDSSFRVTTWNRGSQNLFGYDPFEVMGKPVMRLFSHPASRDLIQQVQLKGVVRNYDIEGITKDRRKISLNLTWAGSNTESIKDKEWTLVIRDVTEQKALQAQLIQAEKLSVVGQLISGVAHEINNPLTAVVGYAELLSAGDDNDPKQVKEDLNFIHQSAIRCREIVANLLRFVRKSELEKKEVNINEVVNVVSKLMEYRLTRKEHIRMDVDLADDLPPVMGDFQQIEQVFVNLIHNACDVLSGRLEPRKISVKTECRDDFVIALVRDNGPGMEQELREKIFEPFFTTKGAGKGTGLGLAISRRIIQDHEGVISVESEPDQGTTFTIKIPVAKVRQAKPPQDRFDHDFISGKRVLIVDDEEVLIPLLRQPFINNGNTVEYALSGRDALEKLQKHAFDLIVCDVELGDIKGQEVYYASRDLKRKPVFVFITGDLLNPKLVVELNRLDVPFLSKPFSQEDFRATITKAFSKDLLPGKV